MRYFVSAWRARHFSIAAQFSSTIRRSPKWRQTVNGTITPASDHPTRIVSLPYCPAGATPGKPPRGSWLSRMSRIHLWKNAAVSALKAPASQKTCVSAVQPRRSLRCGQSVGTER